MVNKPDNNKEIIEHVKANHKNLKYDIANTIDNGYRITLVHLPGNGTIKRPEWFGYGTADYNPQLIKDKILEEFEKKPGKYGYGIILGKQINGYYLICIDIDIDNECKDKVLRDLQEVFNKHKITYHLETTKSSRYHIYILLKDVDDEIRKLTKLSYNGNCIKYKDGREVPGEIEVLGEGRTSSLYNGIINNEKIFTVYPLSPNELQSFKEAIHEYQGTFDDKTINKLISTFRNIRKHNFLNGWEIDKIVSGFCVKNQIPDDIIFTIFEAIYSNEYNKQQTEYIIKKSKQKIDLVPGTGSVIYQAQRLLESKLLTDEETKQVKDFLETIKRSKRDKDNIELPEYLTNVEEIYLLSSRKKHSARKGEYYKEKYFIERNINNVKLVWYVELEADEPFAIYKNHEVTNDPEAIGVKIDIIKRIKEKKRVYQVRINDEHDYIPSTDFESPEQVAREIASEASDYLMSFNLSLFAKYIDIKMRLFWDKHGGVPAPCEISKVTGWSKDLKMFYHYDLNDDKHELHKDHTLYTEYKAESFNQKEQHKLIFELLKEGKLLGFLLDVSASSILLYPFNLQPFTTVITGNPGTGKTSACLVATSLFYKSDGILLTPDATRVGLELKLVSLNSLPFVVDEGSLAEDSAEALKRLIFGVASKKGRTRGKKNLTVETKDVLSNVFWTSEVADIDDIKRGGAFRRSIHLTVERWDQFTKLYDIKEITVPPNEKYSGCGVDYIKYVVENLSKIRRIFDKETERFGIKYKEITGIAKTCYAGIILLEEFYKYYYNLEETFTFKELRKEVDKILEETLKTFTAAKDNVVFALQQYLFENENRFLQYKKEENANRYVVVHRPHVEKLGEYDITERTYYVTQNSFKTIAKELEKESRLLRGELIKAGIMEKEGTTYRSKANQSPVWAYKIKFPDNPLQPPEPPQEPPPTEPPQEPPPQPSPLELPPPTEPQPEPIKPEPETQQEPTDEIDDSLVEAFSRTTYEGKPQKPKEEKTLQPEQQQRALEIIDAIKQAFSHDKEKEKAPQPQEKKKPPKAKEATQPQPEKAQPQDQLITIEGNKIIVNEDKLNIYDVKPTTEIEDISDLENRAKSIKPFSELLVGSLDIETTGTKETDQILAIAFDVFKGDERVIQYRFYLSDYGDDESKMVSEFLDSLAASNIDVLTGYNIYSFDLKMIKSKDKDNKLQFDKEYNIANVIFINQQQQGYCITVNGIYIEVIDAMHLVIKYDNVARSIPAQNYDLKSVAKHFGISKEDRVILGADEIRQYYYTNRKLFDEYLSEDVREAYEVFKKLAPAYYYIKSIVPFDISFFTAFRSSTASIWERILEKAYTDEYKNTLTADDKMSYEGGLVIVNKGLYKNVYKIDVASLYPNIMLNYQVYSRKDTKKVGLIMLKAYTKLRLQLKAKAKAGDKEADLIQNSLKILINSLYGFYGTGGYLFNDMTASALVTAYGRKILKYMIDYVEANGGTIIECDTDGIFFSAVNGEEIYNGLRQELNKINFDIELEYKDCVMFASDKKNYIIITKDDKVIKKGSKYAGRDKNKLQTEFVVEYIKRYINNTNEAETYKKEIRDLITLEKAYDWLKVTKKVGKGEKNIIEDAKAKGVNLEQGSIVTCVFRNHRKHKYCFDWEPQKVYDVEHYLSEFQKLVNEIDSVIQRKQNDG